MTFEIARHRRRRPSEIMDCVRIVFESEKCGQLLKRQLAGLS